MEKTTKIPLFRRCVIQNFPFIEEDFDALTDYGLLCKVVEYLNKAIEQTNTTSTQVEELSVAFNTLKDYVDHYFDNLDVQEEINNKLDEMVEAGTLQEIIATYLDSNVTWTFPTVAEMKNATNLQNGSFARTLGFYSVGDGGGATYRISNTGTADEMSVITVGSLYAILSNTNFVTAEMFGAKGDGTTDDSDSLVAFINHPVKDKRLKAGRTYRISQNKTLQPSSGTKLNGNGATIIKRCVTGTTTMARIIYINSWGANLKNITIENVVFDGDIENSASSTTPAVSVYVGNNGTAKNIIIKNCTVQNVKGHGIALYNDNTGSVANATYSNILIDNCNIFNINGVGIQQSRAVSCIKNCKIDKTSSEAITIDNGCRDCIVDGCEIKRYGYGGGIGIDECYNARIVNNTIDGTNNTASTEYKNAISLNASTGVNYNIVIANNVLINNNTGIYIGTENTSDSYKAVAIGLSFTGNTFRNNSLRDVMLRYATADTRITARGNAYSAQFALGSVENVPRSLLATSLNVDYQFNMSSLITAEDGFTIVKSSAYLYEGELHYDLLVTSTSDLSTGWLNVLTFPCSAYRIEENRIQLYNTALTSIAGYKDVQVNANNYKAYWSSSDQALAMFIRGSFPVNNR